MKWEGQQESDKVEDRRGIGKKGLAIGGGAGLLLLLLGAILGFDPQKLNQLVGNLPGNAANDQAEQRPLTAQEERSRKFAATILRFTEEVWQEQFRKVGQRYEAPHMVLFSERVETGCGTAPSAVGPFYCPADKTVYLDPTFFDELEQKLGGSKAEFSQAYVIAHEVGHHVQNLLGYSRLVDEKRRTLPKEEFNPWSVRLELQADYLAGVWGYHANQREKILEPGDLESALTAAKAIGDDTLQRKAGGVVRPDSFTHGTSEQRIRYFRKGFETGKFSKGALDYFFDPNTDL